MVASSPQNHVTTRLYQSGIHSPICQLTLGLQDLTPLTYNRKLSFNVADFCVKMKWITAYILVKS